MKGAVFFTEFVAGYVTGYPSVQPLQSRPGRSTCLTICGKSGVSMEIQQGLSEIDQLNRLRIFFLRYVTFRS
jgi:hypothetical protein